MKSPKSRRHMIDPLPPELLEGVEPEKELCERCLIEPAEHRVKVWFRSDDRRGRKDSMEFDLCGTCFLIVAKDADRTYEQSMAFWESHRDGRFDEAEDEGDAQRS